MLRLHRQRDRSELQRELKELEEEEIKATGGKLRGRVRKQMMKKAVKASLADLMSESQEKRAASDKARERFYKAYQIPDEKTTIQQRIDERKLTLFFGKTAIGQRINGGGKLSE